MVKTLTITAEKQRVSYASPISITPFLFDLSPGNVCDHYIESLRTFFAAGSTRIIRVMFIYFHAVGSEIHNIQGLDIPAGNHNLTLSGP